MTIPALVDGRLPLGRWPATAAEIEATFVAGKGDKRQELWTQWTDLTAALQEFVAEVPAVWLSGSFLTDKEEPRDIDCVYLLEWTQIVVAKMDPEAAQLLTALASNQVKHVFGLSVDTFILEWSPTSGAKRPSWAKQYLEDRGYWDDLWSRERSTDARVEAMPRRGYLEVGLDGYK